MRSSFLVGVLSVLAGCSTRQDVRAGADPGEADAGVNRDSLDVGEAAASGSFDALHAEILQPRCAGQPGLCHNGQFPPSLVTAAVAYHELVRQVSSERPERLRVEPGEPGKSMLIDKLRNRDVASQMPLGAEPLAESEIAALEAWIEEGALRTPNAPPPDALNLPPATPEIGVFSPTGERIDTTRPIRVAPGDSVVIRHSVEDFETADDAIPFSACSLDAGQGESIVLGLDEQNMPTTDRPTEYAAEAPMGRADLLNRALTWEVTENVTLQSDAGESREVAAAGLTLSVNCFYTDSLTASPTGVSLGFLRFANEPGLIEVQP